METDTALVRTDSRVELYSVTCVCLNLTVIIDPGNLEGKDTLRLYDTLYDLCVLDGIGNTIRVSLSSSPENEVITGREILHECGLR